MILLQDMVGRALDAFGAWVNDEDRPWRALIVMALCALVVMSAGSWS